MTITVRFQFERETKGALRFQEVDADGKVIEQAWSRVGTIYLRKSALERGVPFPLNLDVTIETSGKVAPVAA